MPNYKGIGRRMQVENRDYMKEIFRIYGQGR